MLKYVGWPLLCVCVCVCAFIYALSLMWYSCSSMWVSTGERERWKKTRGEGVRRTKGRKLVRGRGRVVKVPRRQLCKKYAQQTPGSMPIFTILTGWQECWRGVWSISDGTKIAVNTLDPSGSGNMVVAFSNSSVQEAVFVFQWLSPIAWAWRWPLINDFLRRADLWDGLQPALASARHVEVNSWHIYAILDP